ncbi:cuticular protein hypothetical 15 precursor [Danaus plexippus plexippus]|uniref:Cuticular protein hypothetical 15 n=1 Tax=Danaus plexippus plexippus TaxID=278856 RepID=A0A212FGD0_DANPL|nr:cuticular protein hypothetical 15 precursor [Danaus plexippus plexippus]
MFKLVVLFSVLALAAAKPGVVPLAYSYGYPLSSVSSVSQYSSDVVHGSPLVAGVPAVYGSYVPALYPQSVVSGVALAQPPNSPAVVLDGVNGVPLDTPEVVAARAAHYQAKALNVHHLKKRSVSPVSYSAVVAPVVPNVVSPLSYSSLVSSYPAPYVASYPSAVASYGYSSLLPKAYSVHPW